MTNDPILAKFNEAIEILQEWKQNYSQPSKLDHIELSLKIQIIGHNIYLDARQKKTNLEELRQKILKIQNL